MKAADGQPRLILFTALRLACAVMAATCGLAVPAVAIGDIAPDPLSGGVNFSGSTNKVEMSEETVTLDVTATRCATTAVFQMKNLTDAPVTMDVGFPYAYPGDLRGFRVKVDGAAVEDVALKSVGKRRKWKIWTMTFPAKKVTTVEVEYWNELKEIYSWVREIGSVPRLLLSFTAFETKPRGQATEEEMLQYKELAARLQHGDVHYIMKTGAGWAGKIGKCRIEVKFHGFTSDSLITRFPWANPEYQFRDPQILEAGLVWELEDFEPKSNIHFQVSPHITRQELRELIEATLKKHPHHPMLTRLLGEYCEFPEEKRRHQRMVDDMLAAWSPRFAVDGSDYVDREHAQQSIRVWFVVRNLTIRRRDEEPLGDARREKLLPIFKAIARRMLSQMPPEGQTKTDRLNENQVRAFRAEARQVLKWVKNSRSGAATN